MLHQPQGRRVLALALLLAVAGTLAAAVLPTVGAGPFVVRWWLLAPAFALAEVVALQVRSRSMPTAPPLAMAPLAVGLLLATPVDVLIARVSTVVLVSVVWRRQPALRLGLDAGLVAAKTAAAQAVFLTLVEGAHLDSADGRCLAALAGCLVSVALDAAVVSMVSEWYEGRSAGDREVWSLLWSLGWAVPSAGVGAGLSYFASIVPDDRHAISLAFLMVLALGGLKAGRSLADRRRSLEQLHRMSGDLVDASASSGIVGLLLAQSLELVGGRYAEAVLEISDDDVAGTGTSDAAGLPSRDRVACWTLRAGGNPVGPGLALDPRIETLPGFGDATDPTGFADFDEFGEITDFPDRRDQLDRFGAGRSGSGLVGRDTAAERAFLDARGLTDAMWVALRYEDRRIGYLLVGDRALRGAPATETMGRLLQIVANHASVALRNGRLIRRLHVEARQDELTGLPNRLQLRELLDSAAERAADGGPRCAVMVLDLNGFKAINDTLGHQAGDQLLQELARRLAASAGGQATVARLGGDEFAVLSTECGDPASARDLAIRLQSAFAEPVLVSGARLRVGGSIGVALGPEHGRTGSDLLRQADIAMYAAKSAGGGYRMFTPDLVELTAAGLTLATDLRDAIERGEISVVAQPLVDLETDGLHSVEVLARWHHPELGEVPPEQFFAAAERSNQVQALSACVLDHALALSKRAQDGGTRLRVAVNLAARWLSEPTLPEQVGTALDRHGVVADLLCLELTERSVIADPRRVNETLARLRAMGVHLAIDDFGTGYSSLTYLSRLPVDQMKIDKSFVEELDGNERDRAIVRSMIDLGRNLGLEVVAEGVSTLGARQALADLGCRLGQGYLIARPLVPTELLAQLATWKPSTSARSGEGLSRESRESPSVPAPRERHDEPAAPH